MNTIYDQRKDRCDQLTARNREHVAEIAKRFESFPDLDRALGLSSATSHWYSGRNDPSKMADNLCRLWLLANPEAEPQELPAPKSEGQLFLVVCPSGKEGQVRKVLNLIGCEVEAV